jgi:hypothetical protein
VNTSQHLNVYSDTFSHQANIQGNAYSPNTGRLHWCRLGQRHQWPPFNQWPRFYLGGCCN